MLTWLVISNSINVAGAGNVFFFVIYESKLYVPIVTLSAKKILLRGSLIEFQQTAYWDKYQSKVTKVAKSLSWLFDWSCCNVMIHEISFISP